MAPHTDFIPEDERLVDGKFLQHYITSFLRRKMKSGNLTYAAIAEKLGYSTTYVSRIFSGNESTLRRSKYQAIAEAIGIDAEELDTCIAEAKQAELARFMQAANIEPTPPENALPDLQYALRKSGVTQEADIQDILEYIDFKRQSKNRRTPKP